MILRSVHLPQILDAKLCTLSFKLDLSKGEIIRALVKEGLGTEIPILMNDFQKYSVVIRSVFFEHDTDEELKANAFSHRISSNQLVVFFVSEGLARYEEKLNRNPALLNDVIENLQGGKEMSELQEESDRNIVQMLAIAQAL